MKKSKSKLTLRIRMGLFLHCIGTVTFIFAAFETAYKLIGIKTTEDKVILDVSLLGIFYFLAMDAVDKARNWGLIPKHHPKRGR